MIPRRSSAMSASSFLATLLIALCLLAGSARAVTLTYRMQPHERACFYTSAERAGEKIAFYFAVQSGGNFDIDYEVLDPKDNQVLNGHKERQGDFVFASSEAGEYSFCFSNVMSTFVEKLVDFDITAEHETHAPQLTDNVASKAKEAVKKDVESIEDTVARITMEVHNIQRMQKHFRTRENRNFSTVKSTENRIFWFATGESLLIVATAAAQVFLIQTFFNKSGKARV
ncbi:hypothetical protein HK097_001507 [Rhizophlyctis rosea]|uniref:GOLD domain-containing protein n=1 Tax=Rhizophlyctis rosea TaxID=64517 RepID=A0AAD5SJT5_9FUNG|nr:hypothetical protein HK097_001507 [Rhizophlyctis rosea]